MDSMTTLKGPGSVIFPFCFRLLTLIDYIKGLIREPFRKWKSIQEAVLCGKG
jgi:hypothetical protein